MSLFNTIKTGASGLGASGNSLAVIGDNIANLNTRGFKRGRIGFSDVMPQFIGGLNGAMQVGRGVTTSSVQTMHGQGGFQSSGSALDMAIGGRGFFQVSDGKNQLFTRDGSFRLDKDNYVTTLGGLKLVGYQAQGGQITGQAGPLRLETTPMPPRVTSLLTLNAVLDPSVDASTTPLAPLAAAADGSAAAPSLQDMTDAADWSTSITVYDSLGQPHEVTVLFERTGAGSWTYHAVVDGGAIDFSGDGVPDDPNGGALQVATGTLTFDSEGNLIDAVPGTGTPATWPGANPWSPEFDFGQDNGSGNLVANGRNGSAAISLQQDGYPTAFMTSLSVAPDGQIMGQYDNGQAKVLGQVAIARFEADDGLNRLGGNLFQATLQSGDPTLGVAGSAGRGDIAGYALESSNVELEEEFVAMIQSQRSYQANASTIRTSNESLQVLVQLV
jgi:flagellar hook protein FlgE